MSDWIGRTVSKVEIQKLIGRGGMADVYVGRHTTLDRLVAVKVLQSHLSEDTNLLSRFKSEAQAVAAMRHPNIVQVFDFDVVDDRPYIIMEMLDGMSLREYLTSLHTNDLRLQPRTIAHLIAGLSSALDYAHSRGIVHRDIKPANIMLRREGGAVVPASPLPLDAEPVLTDFGVARIANATAHTASGTIIGTPAYMSPEQVRGAIIDSRSDIYSLGIVLYEMLAGRVPFSSETQASILLMQINDPPPPLPADMAALQPVLDRALDKDPNRRFQKSTDLASVLSASLGLPGDTSVTEPRVNDPLVPIDTSDAFTVRLDSPSGMVATSASPLPPSNTTTIQPQQSGFNPLWIAAGIGGLALILGAAALGIVLAGQNGLLRGASTPTAETTEAAVQTVAASDITPTPAEVVEIGSVLFTNDALTASFEGLDPLPEGSFYQAWLIGPAEQPPLSLGKLVVFDGGASVEFKSADGNPLLPRYTGFEITVEQGTEDALKPGPVVYIGQLEESVLNDLNAISKAAPNEPVTKAIVDGVRSQGQVYDSHLGFTIEAVGSGNLAGMKQHAEHVINIAVGKEDDRFGDYNEDDNPQNPGNGVGLETYLRLLLVAIKSTAAAPGTSADVRAAANDLTSTIDSSLTTLDAAVAAEQALAVADSTEEASADQLSGFLLGDGMSTLADQAAGLNLGLSITISSAAP
jgi:serine/threonine-protein kinase